MPAWTTVAMSPNAATTAQRAWPGGKAIRDWRTGWTCAAAPEDRSALENEIARLQRENASLKKTLLARGEGPNPPGANSPGAMTETKPEARPVPPGNVPDPSAKPPGQFQPPSEADVDRALAYVKNVWRKLVDMMMDLQRDIQQRKG